MIASRTVCTTGALLAALFFGVLAGGIDARSVYSGFASLALPATAVASTGESACTDESFSEFTNIRVPHELCQDPRARTCGTLRVPGGFVGTQCVRGCCRATQFTSAAQATDAFTTQSDQGGGGSSALRDFFNMGLQTILGSLMGGGAGGGGAGSAFDESSIDPIFTRNDTRTDNDTLLELDPIDLAFDTNGTGTNGTSTDTNGAADESSSQAHEQHTPVQETHTPQGGTGAGSQQEPPPSGSTQEGDDRRERDTVTTVYESLREQPSGADPSGGVEPLVYPDSFMRDLDTASLPTSPDEFLAPDDITLDELEREARTRQVPLATVIQERNPLGDYRDSAIAQSRSPSQLNPLSQERFDPNAQPEGDATLSWWQRMVLFFGGLFGALEPQ